MQIKLCNNEAEQSLLACMSLSPNVEMLEQIFEMLVPNDFYIAEYRTIFAAIQMLYNKGKTIDYITISETLERLKMEGDETNYVDMLLSLNSVVPNTLHWLSYAKIVLEHSKLRKIENILRQASEEVATLHNSNEVLQSLAQSLEQIDLEKVKPSVEQIGETVQTELELLGKKARGEVDDFGLATGFSYLDTVLWGLQPSELIILGARAGVGKTAFGLNVLNYVANTLNKNCLFFSLEMSKNQIAQRLLCICSKISNLELRDPKQLTETKKKLLEQAERKILAGNLYIDDTTDNTVQAMMHRARQLKRMQGLDLVVVDYLQFIRPLKKSGFRHLDVGEIARDLKVMARQLQVPVIALCQLNRALDNEDRMPTMADLRESGEIENNADIIMFLHSKSDRYDAVKNIDLVLGKFRRGAMQAVRMEYRGETYTFRELDKIETQKAKQMELTPLDSSEGLPF